MTRPLYRKSVSRRLASLGEKVLSFASKFVFCGRLLLSNHDKTPGLIQKRIAMKFHALVRMATTLALLYAGISVLPGNVYAQVIHFSQIDAFESMGTGTLRGASPPKTIVDDDERHTIFVTIWESDTEAKVYWKSLDENLPRTTIISGPGVHAFQT